MSLLEELKGKRESAAAQIDNARWRISCENDEIEKQQAIIADLDRAIAALSVPEVAEVEIPDGFVKWEGGESPFFIGTHLEVFTRKNGVWPVVIKPEAPLLWEHEGHDLDIIAYRVLPIEPAEYEDPTAVAIAAHIEAEQADYPDLTDEQDAAIESATAEYQSTDGAEIVSGEPWSISASEQHAEESARAQDLVEPYPQVELDKLVPPLPPLFPPEREQPATPESLRAGGIVDSEASWWARKLTKVEA